MRSDQKTTRHLIRLTCVKYSAGDVIYDNETIEELEGLPTITFDGEENGIHWTTKDTSPDADWCAPFVVDKDFIAFETECIGDGINAVQYEELFLQLSYDMGWQTIFEGAMASLMKSVKDQWDNDNKSPVQVLTVWSYTSFVNHYFEGDDYDFEWAYLGLADLSWPQFIGEKVA